MRTLVKLLLAALFLHAAWRVGTAYWLHYQLEDEVRRLAQVSAALSETAIREKVLTIAGDLGLQLPEDMVVQKQSGETLVRAEYAQMVELVPRYRYRWPFTLNVRNWSLEARVPR